MSQSNAVKVSNLLNKLSLLALAINSGIKASIEVQVLNTWQCVKDLIGDVEIPYIATPPQQAFIEPVAFHAFCKLNLSAGALINTTFINQSALTSAGYMKHYLELICLEYKFKLNLP